MNDTITRLHPDLPLCWEDPDTLRIGFERAVVRVRRPSPGTQRLLGALRAGISPVRLMQEVRRIGATPGEAQQLLALLAPALETAAPQPPGGPGSPGPRGLRALVCDDGREVPGLRGALSATGLCALDEQPSDREGYELVVHVERFLEPLERAQRWLSRAVPHLLVRFTDSAVHVGPLVSPRGAPCHTCCALAMLAEDPAYPVLAAQLYGTTPTSETAAGAHMAAAFAAMLIGRWRAGDAAAHTTRAVIPMRAGQVDGAPSLTAVTPHPDCACAAG